MRTACSGAMRHPSDSVPSNQCRTSILWSFSVSQGLHLHVSDPPGDSSPKALRKYDFRLLTPSTVGTFHRRGHAGSGTSPSVTQITRSLMARGKQCVLSLRPERRGNKAENENSGGAEESERGARDPANRTADGQRRTGEEKKRAQSGVVRTRVTVTPDTRPSTAPARARADVRPTTPGYRMLWRTSESGHHDTDRSSTGTPVLHLYLPNYSDPRKEADEVPDVEADRRDADGKPAEIQIQERLDASDDGNGNRAAAGGNGAPEDAEDVIAMETGSEQKSKTEEGGDGRRGSRDERAEKEESERRGVRGNSCDIAQEPSEEHGTVEAEGRSGKSGDTPELTVAAPATKLKCADVRNLETRMTRRLPLPAPALSFPATLARTDSSSSPPCEPPSFYGSTFGRRVRAPHAPEPHRAKTGVCYDKRAVKPAPRGITAPRPKITSPEWRDSLPRKTKTTKTFVWGPRGPQETKCVCELRARTSAWRRLDWCRGSGEHAPPKMFSES